MKTGFTVCFALCLGCVIAYWLFGLAFHMNIQRFNHAAFAPHFGRAHRLLDVSSGSSECNEMVSDWDIGPHAPAEWILFLGVVAEGRGAEWSHLTTILKVAAAVFAWTIIGWVIKRVIRKQRAG